jgi:topoisomerase-4 subunit A
VLVRRARTRIGKIADRLELLDGYLIAFLNLDRVIQIIREEDEPKAVMMAEFGLSDRQAERSSTCVCARFASSRRCRSAASATRSARKRTSSASSSNRRSPAQQAQEGFGRSSYRYAPETELGRRRTTIEEPGPRARFRWKR